MASQPSALRVVQATGFQGNNYNPQGGNYNPQQTAPSPQQTAPAHVVQPAAPARVVQPAYRAVSPVRRSTQAEVEAAAAEQRRRVEEAAAQQRLIVRQQVQANVDLKVASQRQQLKLAVAPVQDRSKFIGLASVKNPELVDNRDDYTKERDKVFARARATFDDLKGGGDFWDSLTGDKQDNARKFAEDQLRVLSEGDVPEYSKRLDSFLVEQAKRKDAIEHAKFKSKAEFDKAVADYTSWESAQIAGLEKKRAYIEGAYDAWSQFSGSEINAVLPNIGRGFNDFLATPAGQVLSNVWKYTLGSGDENTPSIVTAPSRAINAIGNFFDPNRTVYRSDGTEGKLDQSKNAWQNTFNQRNFNIAPNKPISFDQWLDTKRTVDSNGNSMTYRQWIDSIGGEAGKKQHDKLFNLYQGENRSNDAANNTAEFFADPLFAVSWLKAAKLPEAVAKSKFITGIAGSKPVSAAKSFIDKIASSKVVQWLSAESKSPQQKFIDAVTAAKQMQGEAQKIFPTIAKLHDQLTGKKISLDYTVFDDLAKLTDNEAKMLQQMVGGKLDKAKWFQRGKFANPVVRDKLESIATRYKKITDQMARVDKVFQRENYFARTEWLSKKGKSLDDYNFRLAKTKPGYVQSAKDLAQSQVDRFFKSDLESYVAEGATKSQNAAKTKLQKYLGRYNDLTSKARSDVESAYAKTQTPYGRFRGAVDRFGPTALWKKAVLKYRPAWTVNNIAYNTQAAALAGGSRSIFEQLRLLRPKNFKAALDEIPSDVLAEVAPELGKGRLSKFYNRVENTSRIAAFRAAKAKGLTDAQALKRVNRYLFNYKTKNWERPLKAAIPFWGWQKNLTKAAIQMPFDRPLYAKVYNRLDREQQMQYDRDFDKVVPRLKELGYSDSEIEAMRAENAKFFANRLKVGDNYVTTPFNPFSEGGLGNLGLNPYLESLGEYQSAKDKFGRPLSATNADFFQRVGQKFPQFGLAKKGYEKFMLATGQSKPVQRWVGEKGSEGYGLTKEAQGYDPSKPNYQSKLDPSAKLNEDLAAFVGVPRGLKFDTAKLLERKTMEKLKTEYFATDWKSMDFPAQEAARKALFEKYGVTSDQFYKGELSKYDSEATMRIKQMKEDAFSKTKQLFDELNKQPKGTRNAWATQKLKELVDSGYFSSNPFLKSFDWTNPDTIAKAYKQIAYNSAKSSGDFSAYNAKYGMSKKAAAAGFWKKYYATTDKTVRRQLLRDNPQYAKNGVKSEFDISKAEFWYKYANSNKFDRRKLLAENPQFNERANWTSEQWDSWSAAKKRDELAKLSSKSEFVKYLTAARSQNRRLSAPVAIKKQRSRNKKLVFMTS